MTVHDYLLRIRRYTRFDDMCFLVALVYLGRLAEMGGPSFCLTYHNVHRLIVTALVLASKSSDDVFHANAFMAQCGGAPLAPAARAAELPRPGRPPRALTPRRPLPSRHLAARAQRPRD